MFGECDRRKRNALKILGKQMHSAVEWRRSYAPNISSYNDICDFPGRCVKTTSFYVESCVSKRPSFRIVCVRAQSVVFYYVFVKISLRKHNNNKFLQ